MTTPINPKFYPGEKRHLTIFLVTLPPIQEILSFDFAMNCRLALLGSLYGDLGETQRGIEYNEQALVIFRELGDKI